MRAQTLAKLTFRASDFAALRLRPLPVSPSSSPSPSPSPSPRPSPSARPSPSPSRSPRPSPSPSPRAKLEPLSPRRFKLQFTASQELVDKLTTAQHLLKHQLPAGDIDAVLERPLDELKTKARKPKARPTKPKQKRPAVKHSRHVSAADKRVVVERDGMQCTFVDARGLRCPERGGLDLAHIEAHGRGGSNDASNLQLRCRAHNRLDADRDYGRATMNRAVEHARRRRRCLPPRPVPKPEVVAEPPCEPRQVEMF